MQAKTASRQDGRTSGLGWRDRVAHTGGWKPAGGAPLVACSVKKKAAVLASIFNPTPIPFRLRVCVCARARACVRACVRARAIVCLSVCACPCVRASAVACACVCVCVCVCVCARARAFACEWVSYIPIASKIHFWRCIFYLRFNPLDKICIKNNVMRWNKHTFLPLFRTRHELPQPYTRTLGTNTAKQQRKPKRWQRLLKPASAGPLGRLHPGFGRRKCHPVTGEPWPQRSPRPGTLSCGWPRRC